MGADSAKDLKDPLNNSSRGNTIVRAKDIYTNQSEQKFKQSGLTVSVSNSLVDSAKAIDSLVDAGGNTDSTRMKGMAAVAGALKAKALAAEADKAAQGLFDNGINADSLKGLGNTRIQATIGSQKSQSNSSSYTEQNQASSIITNNLALIATGGGTDSNININGSNLNVTSNALFQADNDFNVNGVAQNSNTRSDNKSSSTAIGAYASTNAGQGASAGITASGSRAKGYANSDSVTYADSNINVGGTTTLDIGNDVNIKGGVINTNKAQGTIGGNVNIESLQDTATYDSNQKNMGFTLDVDLKGAGSSLSLNGGKTNVNADYKAVGEQSGIFTGDGGFNLVVDGKTTLIGGAITTTEAAKLAGRNNYISKGGITTQDIENTSSYEGDAIQVGVSLGMTEKKPQGGLNGLGYGTDSDSDSSITKAGITGIAGNSGITTDNQAEYAGALENVFEATRVNEELGAQTEITQAFDQERRKIKTELNAKEKALRDAAKEAFDNGDDKTGNEKLEAAQKIQNNMLLFDGISGALYGPNTNGVVGYAAKAISPQIANRIGQIYKQNDANNVDNDTNLAGVGSPQHLLAHAILGAAVSYATGNDALTGGLGASAGEGTALILSKYIYKVDNPSELTAEQKDTISSIASLAGLAIGASAGEVTDAVNAGETALVATQDNAIAGTSCVDMYGADNCAVREALGYSKFGTKSPSKSQLDAYRKGRKSGLSAAGSEILNDLEQAAKLLNPFEVVEKYKFAVGMAEYMKNPIDNTTAVVMSKVDFINALNAAKANAKANPTAKNLKLYGELDAIFDTKAQYNIASVVLPSGIAASLRTASLSSSAIRNSITDSSSARVDNNNQIDDDLGNKPSGRPEYNPNSNYNGGLVKVPKPDPDADALATRIGGESRVRFKNDNREFDVISDKYVGQAKPANYNINKTGRDQAKATFDAARDTGRKVYYHFDGPPNPNTIRKLEQYSKEYNIPIVIDTKPF